MSTTAPVTWPIPSVEAVTRWTWSGSPHVSGTVDVGLAVSLGSWTLVGDVSELFATTRGTLPAKVPVDDEADILLRFQTGATGHIWRPGTEHRFCSAEQNR